jgi:hypothetical protein
MIAVAFLNSSAGLLGEEQLASEMTVANTLMK